MSYRLAMAALGATQFLPWEQMLEKRSCGSAQCTAVKPSFVPAVLAVLANSEIRYSGSHDRHGVWVEYVVCSPPLPSGGVAASIWAQQKNAEGKVILVDEGTQQGGAKAVLFVGAVEPADCEANVSTLEKQGIAVLLDPPGGWSGQSRPLPKEPTSPSPSAPQLPEPVEQAAINWKHAAIGGAVLLGAVALVTILSG